MPVVLGDTQQRRDRLEGKLGGDVGEHVAASRGHRRVEERIAAFGERGFDRAEPTRCDRWADDATQVVMARVVGHVQQDTRSETGRQVLDERAPTGAVAAGRRREERRLAGRPLHVGIAGEAPEPFAVGREGRRLVPVERIGVAEVIPDVVRRTVRKRVGVGEIDVGWHGPSRSVSGQRSKVATTGAWSDQRAAYVGARWTSTPSAAGASAGEAIR